MAGDRLILKENLEHVSTSVGFRANGKGGVSAARAMR